MWVYLLMKWYICGMALENDRMCQVHTGKCIRRIGGIYAYCRYFIDRKWHILV